MIDEYKTAQLELSKKVRSGLVRETNIGPGLCVGPHNKYEAGDSGVFIITAGQMQGGISILQWRQTHRPKLLKSGNDRSPYPIHIRPNNSHMYMYHECTLMCYKLDGSDILKH
jgi:hypothetical protein